MSNACDAFDSCNISPVRPKVKHTTTPMRTRRKTSRREQGVDVHTTNACSTPSVHRSPRLSRSTQNSPRFKSPSHFSSPSCSIPSSQDQPDVIWDFNSPKLPKSGKKKELKITVQEFLENLSQCQSSECNSQSGTYMKLLENWMSKPAEATVKKTLDNKKHLKKRSRQRIEDLKNFIVSIQRPETNINKAPIPSKNEEHSDCEPGDKLQTNAAESNRSLKNSFLEGGSTDDSSEELWGDMDSSFIVKATQELDKISDIPAAATYEADEIISTIPLTVSVPISKSLKSQSPAIVKEKHCEQLNDFLLQLSSIDWDDDDDEWDNGFLLEDDDLSLIPEDVLSGECVKQKEEKENVPQKSTTSTQNPKLLEVNALFDANIGKTGKKKSETSCNLVETEFSVKAKVVPTIELDNSFEDDSFEDESLLCQPEVLSRIDEVESMLSQPKCTPEEIKKKKEEAINRRKNMQLRKKNKL